MYQKINTMYHLQLCVYTPVLLFILQFLCICLLFIFFFFLFDKTIDVEDGIDYLQCIRDEFDY